MADYIDKNKLLKKHIHFVKGEEFNSNRPVAVVKTKDILNMPSVDAVEVVRCIKCKYSKYILINGLCDGLFCYKIGRPIDDDFFCKWGKKE